MAVGWGDKTSSSYKSHQSVEKWEILRLLQQLWLGLPEHWTDCNISSDCWYQPMLQLAGK